MFNIANSEKNCLEISPLNKSILTQKESDLNNKNVVKVQWGANFQIIGKTDPQNLSGPWAWQNQTGTLVELADHLRNGHPFMPSLLSGNRRRLQGNANYATMLALDIDEGMTIAEAVEHPFIRRHCGLGIETTSSKPEQHKFRLVFPMREAIEGWQQIKAATLYLQHLVGTADKACSDASRFYFGSLGRSPFILQDVTLPANFLEQAEAWQAERDRVKAEKRAQQERIRREAQERIRAAGNADLVELVEQANDRLGFDAFLPYLEHQGEQNGKYRCKPAFRTGSGSYSAFVAENGGKVTYQDPTAGHGCDGFRFYCWHQRGEGFKPNGKDFVELAKEYCSIAGIDVPEWQPRTIETPPTKPKYDFEPQSLQDDEADEFADRLSAYQATSNFILDQSGTGSGKTHFDGELRPVDLGVSRIFYISSDAYNPTVESLKDDRWKQLSGRHGGLKLEVMPDGTKRLQRCKPGEAYSVAPNCSRSGVVQTLRDANVNGADTASVVCGTCPQREQCAHSFDGINFLGQRRRALAAELVRCNPESLPDPAEFDYSNSALIWDDTLPRTSRTIEVDRNDVARTIADLADQVDLIPQLSRLYRLFDEELPYYGLSTNEVIEQAVIDGDVDILEVLTSPNLSELLNPVSSEGVDLADLPKEQRKFYSSDVTQGVKTIAKQWLCDYIRVCKGLPGGSLNLNHGKLTITLPDPRFRQIVRAAKKNIFQDATTTKQNLALVLGVEPETIAVVRKHQPELTNLKLIQIADLGTVTRQRGKDQERRIQAIVEHFQGLGLTKTIDFKGKDCTGYWFRDNRGSNNFQDAQHLILIGTPYMNLGAAQSQFSAMVGDPVDIDDDDFLDWYRQQVTAEINQALGRLRANRREEPLTIVLVSDFPIAGFEQVKAESITPMAADKKSKLWQQAKEAGLNLLRQGAKLTQSAIGSAIEVTQGRVSQLMTEFGVTWEGFQELLILLLEPYSKINNLPPDDDPEVTKTLVDMVQTSPPSEIFRELISIFASVGRIQLGHVLNFVSVDTRQEWQRLTQHALSTN